VSLTSDISISGDVDQSVMKRVYRLLTTPAGSIPWDRNFGIDPSVLDNTPAATEGALLVQYTQKLKSYFPTLKISKISFSYDGNKIMPQVVISNV
jgi:phage baseplate assembly protein W